MGKKREFILSDREYIERALKKRKSVQEIADFLDCSRRAVYYEIKKGLTMQLDSKTLCQKEVYLADVAERKTKENKKRRGVNKKLDSDDARLTEIKELILAKKYSPEAARIKTGCKDICTKTIYNYVHSGHLKGVTVDNLPYARKKRKKHKKVAKRIQKPVEKLIEKRPQEAADRKIYGHWEMDTVYSSKDDKSCLLVLSERMTREELIIQTKDRTAKSILSGLNHVERKLGAKTFRETFRSITCDNGVEFSDWDAMEKSSINKKLPRTEIYFCHPYCSSERGTNENENRMIRRWIPKGDDIGLYTKKEIRNIQDWMNDYPRGILGGMSVNSYKKMLGLPDIMNKL